jgi:Rrf2 family protein
MGFHISFSKTYCSNSARPAISVAKGKGGGYYLIKEPKEIPLSRVIRLLDGPIALLPCVSLNYYEPCAECKDEAQCGINKVMIQVRDETLKILENKSIQDILDGE